MVEGYTAENRPKTVPEMFEDIAKSVVALYVDEVRREEALKEILGFREAIIGDFGSPKAGPGAISLQERIIEILKMFDLVKDSEKSYEELLYDRYKTFMDEHGSERGATKTLTYHQFTLKNVQRARGPWSEVNRSNTIHRFETILREGWVTGSKLVMLSEVKGGVVGRTYTVHHFTPTCLIAFEHNLSSSYNPCSFTSAPA